MGELAGHVSLHVMRTGLVLQQLWIQNRVDLTKMKSDQELLRSHSTWNYIKKALELTR